MPEAGRDGKIDDRRHPKGSKTATGRNFYDLECPRDQVVAFAIYTVHNNILKMTAQLHPLFPDETRMVRLEIKEGNSWKEVTTAKINDLGWSALFRVEKWNDTIHIPYRVRHGEKAMFEGTIRKNPIDKEVIVLGSLSCNSSRDRMDRAHYIRNLLAADPDLLFFAGDQHYDHTEHTAGWLMWGAQFKEVIKDRPVITIPDDHDVGQGNLWGEGGILGKGKGNSGGYIYHHEYIKQVERCQTAHLPDPYDPTPIEQGINVYYTSYILGGIDFAILEDRKFKSGPNGKIPKQGPRPDHIRNPEYIPKSVDIKGLKLLGDRQLKFLDDWADDWKGVEMKAALSQTPFAGAAHMHGGPTKRLHADLDSNGWPQTGRNNALRALRKGFACHLSGDQHLATLLQHGIDEFNDGPWSMVSPAIVNSIYGRFWHPASEKPGANQPKGSPLKYTGEYFDGFGNRVSMHGYANADDPANRDTMKAAGFVIARFNKKDRTITAECWPRNVDLTQPNPKQFGGWPKVIAQTDNFNPPSWGKLGELTFNKSNPVVQLIDAKSEEVLYTLRIKGNRFTPHAPKEGSFTIKAGVDAPGKVVVKKASVSNAKPTAITIK